MKEVFVTSIIVLALFFASCEKGVKPVNNSKEKPKQETKKNDFSTLIPSDYEIEYETKGDLNGDNVDDIAVVVKRKIEFKGTRKVLIFIKNNNNYRLDKSSKTVFPNKYFSKERDIETYYQEEIEIKDKELRIKLYGTGPVGNNFSTFKYSGEKLLLTNIETYNNGAGGSQSINYDVLNAKLVIENTNMLKENMPTETQVFNFRKKEYLFENSNPDLIMTKAYIEIEKQEPE